VIGESVEIGDGCRVGTNVLIEGNTRIGKNNTFYHGASVGTPPQDLKYDGELTRLVVGDGNTFREFVTVNTATGEGEATVIGSRCMLMAYAHVAHNCVIGDDVILANSVNLAGHVFVDDYAIVGGVTPVHQFVRIGRHAFVGGGSRVERDVPPFMKIAGSPPQVYGINSVGLERRGFDGERRGRIKQLYKLIYRSDLNVSQALEALGGGEYRHDEDAATLAEFISESMRGITK
jgi:UDP-N-acetylglucosamine acyltransferase